MFLQNRFAVTPHCPEPLNPAHIVNLSLRFFRSTPILPGFSMSFGFSTLYISLVILLPISALLLYVSGMSWDQYWFAITDARVLPVSDTHLTLPTICSL